MMQSRSRRKSIKPQCKERLGGQKLGTGGGLYPEDSVSRQSRRMKVQTGSAIRGRLDRWRNCGLSRDTLGLGESMFGVKSQKQSWNGSSARRTQSQQLLTEEFRHTWQTVVTTPPGTPRAGESFRACGGPCTAPSLLVLINQWQESMMPEDHGSEINGFGLQF